MEYMKYTQTTAYLIKYKKITHTFRFASLIMPNLISNINLKHKLQTNQKKVLLKQSYIVLTWFYYLSFLNSNQIKDKKKKIKIFVTPLKNKKFTLTKAPMAHKNWSKEQYLSRFYYFQIKFNTYFTDLDLAITAEAAIFFIFLTKKNLINFETNSFFLKNYKTSFHFHDKKYFNYYYL